MQIAIDGPVAAGKGTVAKILADKLHYLYVDTGALYRAVALLISRHDLVANEANEAAIVELLKQSKIWLDVENGAHERLVKVTLNGEDVSEAIRTPEVSSLVPLVASLAGVRRELVVQQQAIAQFYGDVVMEGRDITFRVLPDAPLKIFMTADPEVRAQRRLKQQQAAGHIQTYEEVLEDLEARDKRDTTRAVDPLQIVSDAVVIDTTPMSIDEVVAAILQLVADTK
jgi:cytidylate kinase